MKKLCLIALLGFPIFGSLSAQQQSANPKLRVNPNSYIQTHGVLDSVVQYSYYSLNDSACLNKWEYVHDETIHHHQSMKYIWIPESKEWLLDYKHEYNYNDDGSPILQAHPSSLSM